MRVGVLIVAFNRPDKLKKVIEGLKMNKEYIDVDLFFSVDGPRKDNLLDEHFQNEIIRLIEIISQEHPSVSIRISHENLGVASNIIKSIDWSFEKVEALIILEDDIEIISDQFL